MTLFAMPRARVLVALLVSMLAAGGTACGSGDDAPAMPPAKVATELAPPALQGGELTLALDAKAEEAFRAVGNDALVADGHLWAIRGSGDRLVGTLQIATLKPQVDLAYPEDRRQVMETVITGARSTITVGGLEVVQSKGDDQKTVFLWFGDKLFQVLQLKSTSAVSIEPEVLLAEVISYQTAQPSWRAVAAGASGAGGESRADEEDEGWRPR